MLMEEANMPMTHNFLEKMGYLVRTTGHAEVEIVAEALEKGLSELYREQVADSYLAGVLNRGQAILELGEDVPKRWITPAMPLRRM